jgi:hypothetical protein
LKKIQGCGLGALRELQPKSAMEEPTVTANRMDRTHPDYHSPPPFQSDLVFGDEVNAGNRLF